MFRGKITLVRGLQYSPRRGKACKLNQSRRRSIVAAVKRRRPMRSVATRGRGEGIARVAAANRFGVEAAERRV